MEHECKFEEKIIEMSGDIKTLVAEFKAMNGSLLSTKHNFEKHEEDSKLYRRQIDIIWVGTQAFKWTTLFLFGSGCIWKLIEIVLK
jgi:hypothetical protein